MEKANEYVTNALSKTKKGLTRFFDTIDIIDRKLYGKRVQYFAWGVLIVLVISPVLDWTLEIPHDRLTWLSTLIFVLFVAVMVLSWLSSWRDDAGNWTWHRAKSKLKSYYEIVRDTSVDAKKNTSEEFLYKAGKYLVFGSLTFQAFRNISIFIRKPLEHWSNDPRLGMRGFEHTVHKYYWIALIIGLAIIYYLYRKNGDIFAKIKHETRQIFGSANDLDNKYHNEIARIGLHEKDDLVINATLDNHLKIVISQSKSQLFTDFVNALSTWNPKNCYYEYEFQDKLCNYLRKKMPEAIIESEKPIGSVSIGNKGRADIVINDTILIEMKRDSSAGAIQRANGQINQYTQIWKDKGPVILLLCDHNFDHAKTSYTPALSDLFRLERPVLAIVANPK